MFHGLSHAGVLLLLVLLLLLQGCVANDVHHCSNLLSSYGPVPGPSYSCWPGCCWQCCYMVCIKVSMVCLCIPIHGLLYMFGCMCEGERDITSGQSPFLENRTVHYRIEPHSVTVASTGTTIQTMHKGNHPQKPPLKTSAMQLTETTGIRRMYFRVRQHSGIFAADMVGSVHHIVMAAHQPGWQPPDKHIPQASALNVACSLKLCMLCYCSPP